MTVKWTASMVSVLDEMIAQRPRPSLEAMGERLGVARCVVIRYCRANGLSTGNHGGARVASAATRIRRQG